MNSKQLMVADGAPKALFMTPEQRRKAWAGRPLTVPVFVQLQRDESEEVKAMRERLKAEATIALKNRIARAEARKANAKIDYSKMRWDARRNRFVPLEPWATKPAPSGTTESAPAVKAPRRDSAVKARGETTPAGADIVTKDNAEAVARLNNVWKPEYEKLRGTGRIVMTVGNLLRGIVKRGGTVKWQ